NNPKIALGMGDGGAPVAPGSTPDPLAGPRRIKQLGVNHVLGGGPPIPWTDESLNRSMERWKSAGILVGNLMINLTPDILYGKSGAKRDEDIEKIKLSITAAGEMGVPVIEYNFYAHR